MALLKRQKAGAVRNKGKEGQDSWRGLLPGDKGLPALVARWALVSSAVLWGESLPPTRPQAAQGVCMLVGVLPAPGLEFPWCYLLGKQMTSRSHQPPHPQEGGRLGTWGLRGPTVRPVSRTGLYSRGRSQATLRQPGRWRGLAPRCRPRAAAGGSPWSQTSGMPKRRRFPAGVCLWVNC